MKTILRIALTLGALLRCASPQDVSAYELGKRMTALERRLEQLERTKTASPTSAEIAAIRADLAALERQVQHLSAQDITRFQKDLAELKTLLLRFEAALNPAATNATGTSMSAGEGRGSVKQTGNDQFRIVVPKQRGWFDTRLPYAGNCSYEISSSNPHKYEVTTRSKIYWYNAGYNTEETLNLNDTGTIKVRVNDEAPTNAMVFEITRRIPTIGFCYGPAFEPLPLDRTICDLEYPIIGDDTPPIVQGLNSIAPLFGVTPTKSEPRKRAHDPNCPAGSPGGPLLPVTSGAPPRASQVEPAPPTKPRTWTDAAGITHELDAEGQITWIDNRGRRHIVINGVEIVTETKRLIK